MQETACQSLFGFCLEAGYRNFHPQNGVERPTKHWPRVKDAHAYYKACALHVHTSIVPDDKALVVSKPSSTGWSLRDGQSNDSAARKLCGGQGEEVCVASVSSVEKIAEFRVTLLWNMIASIRRSGFTLAT